MNKVSTYVIGSTLLSTLFLFSALPGYAGNQQKNKSNFTNSNKQKQLNQKKFKYNRQNLRNSARSRNFKPQKKRGLVLGDGNPIGNKNNFKPKKRKDLVLNGLGVKGSSKTNSAKSSKRAPNIQNYKTTKVKKPAPKSGVVFEVETTLKKKK